MSKPFDATSKAILDLDPSAWAALVGIAEPVRVIDSDLSTVTAAADKILVVEANPEYILHTEFQAQYDEDIPTRVLGYSGMIISAYKMHVWSVVVLLTKKADGKAITGEYRVEPASGPAWTFRYTVIRVWELSAEELLTGPLSILPFAPIANVQLTQVAGILNRVADRVTGASNSDLANRVWSAMGVFLQMRYGKMITEELLEEHPELEEYVIFQIPLRRGVLLGVQNSLLQVGRKKFGPSTPEIEATISAVTDRKRLDSMLERMLDVTSWHELLAE